MSRAIVVFVVLLGTWCVARAQYIDEISLEEYLSLLEQITPAARNGAEHYLIAFKSKCGRDLTTMELRRAVAEGDGNPVLMAMIRAAHQQDSGGIQRLATKVSCPIKR